MPRKRVTRLRCPVCRKAVRSADPDFPFCSGRCRTIDLGRWASGAYVVSTPLHQADRPGEADYALEAQRRAPASQPSSKESHGQRKRS